MIPLHLAAEAPHGAGFVERWLEAVLGGCDNGAWTRANLYGSSTGSVRVGCWVLGEAIPGAVNARDLAVEVASGATASVELVARAPAGFYVSLVAADLDAQLDAAELYARLLRAGLEPLRHVTIYASGRRGLHVEARLAYPWVARCERDGRAVLGWGEWLRRVLGVSPDPAQGVAAAIRAPLSPHPETGARKVPLDVDGSPLRRLDEVGLEPMPREVHREVARLAAAFPDPCARRGSVSVEAVRRPARRLPEGLRAKLVEALKEAWVLGRRYEGLHDALAFGVAGALAWRGYAEDAVAVVVEVVEWALGQGLERRRSDAKSHVRAARQAVKCVERGTCRAWGLPALEARLREIGALGEPTVQRVLELLRSLSARKDL